MTHGESRSPREKRADAVVVGRVKRGIELLKRKYGPDFADHIDMNEFDIQSPHACILGQLYGDAEVSEEQWIALESHSSFSRDYDGYAKGLAILDEDVPNAPYEYGFDRPEEGDYSVLQLAWEDELAELRGET